MSVHDVVCNSKGILCAVCKSDRDQHYANIDNVQFAAPYHLAEFFDDMMTARDPEDSCLMVDVECFLLMLVRGGLPVLGTGCRIRLSVGHVARF